MEKHNNKIPKIFTAIQSFKIDKNKQANLQQNKQVYFPHFFLNKKGNILQNHSYSLISLFSPQIYKKKISIILYYYY